MKKKKRKRKEKMLTPEGKNDKFNFIKYQDMGFGTMSQSIKYSGQGP